jgi:predicted ATPase/DNA-binding SARP family transcriptional activator
MSVALSITVMGQFAIRLNGESQAIKSLPRRKVRSLLKLLALEPSHALTRDVLIEHLWADLDPTSAAAQLYNALYNLRKALGDLIAPKLVAGVVRLEPQGGLSVDANLFTTLAREGLADKDVTKLLQAAHLIDGQPMTEDLYEDWADSYRQELLGLQTQVLESLARLDAPQAEFAWQKYLQLEPTSEIAYLGLIRFYAATGLPKQATEQFERYRQMLSEELAAEPSAEAIEIMANLDKPSQAQTKAIRSFIPAPTVPLVGREIELEALRSFFEDSDWRLLTILGIGGNGKTRLALEAARENQALFADGVFWVALENLKPTDDPSGTVLQVLGLPIPSSQAETVLLNYLRDKNCLLVLDNLEHLPEIGLWVQRILTAAEALKILTTSRSLLHLEGERVLELSGLSPEAAINLFVQSATRVKPAFSPNEKSTEQIGLLTEHLAGSPLAIELAASWIRLMSLEEIAAEIQLDLDFLERPVKDRHARHHSVRAVFDSSWRLLELPEQQTLVSLAVFVGGFTLLSARAVSGASRAAIVALTDRSLLHLQESRLELHPLLRQFVLERAAQNPERLSQTRQAHAAHYLELLAALPARYRTKNLEAYLETKRHVDLMYQNTRAAWQWALNNQQFDMLESSLDGFFVLHQLGDRLVEISAMLPENLTQTAHLPSGFATYRAVAKTALGQFKEAEQEFILAIPNELSPEQQTLRLIQLSTVYSRTARVPQALSYAEQALELAKTTNFFMQCLSYLQLSDVLAILGKFDESQAALDAARVDANVRLQSFINIQAATLAGRKGQLEQAEFEFRQAQKLLAQLGDIRNLQVVHNNLATALQLQGKYLESQSILETSAKEARFLGDQRMLAVIHNGQLESLRALGQYQEALQVANKNLELCKRTGNTLRTAECTLRIGHVYFELGQYSQALAQYQAAQALEIPEITEEILVSLARVYLQEMQVEHAKALLERTTFKTRAFIAWAAVLNVIVQHQTIGLITYQHLKTVFETVQTISAKNACECLASMLEPLAQLEPNLAQQLAHSLLLDSRASYHSKVLTRVFAGQEEPSIAVVPWLSLIKDFLEKTTHGTA